MVKQEILVFISQVKNQSLLHFAIVMIGGKKINLKNKLILYKNKMVEYVAQITIFIIQIAKAL